MNNNTHNILDYSKADEAFIGAFLGKLSLIQTADRFESETVYKESDIERAALVGNSMANYVIKSLDLN